MRLGIKTRSIGYGLVAIGVFSFALVAHAAEPAFREVQPRLQIPIPNLQFSRIASPEAGSLYVSYLPEYISAVYSYLVGIAGIFAVAMIMYGGMKWIFAAGDTGKIGAAKETIYQSVIGLILALGSYLILITLNPDLVSFKSLKLLFVPVVQYEEGGDSDTSLTGNAIANARALGIHCPGSGGSEAIPQISQSFAGKVAYRFGGKGGPPPYSEKPSGSFTQYNNNCPTSNICLDCSGFIALIYQCAGLANPGGGSAGMLGSAERITSIDLAANPPTVNGVALKAGDILGWVAGETHEVGHVTVYLGNGLIAESKGGTSGRQPGGNPRIRPVASYRGYGFTRIKRVP
ncbi:C40 family peptidase [Candidatus Uhrbacteria bacterium]|nr:C40 family peptidase [Candidatus Uhrbacteria bacterium]